MAVATPTTNRDAVAEKLREWRSPSNAAPELPDELKVHAEAIAEFLRQRQAESQVVKDLVKGPPTAVEWGEQNFYIPTDTGRPRLIRFLPHQRTILALFFDPRLAELLGCGPNFQTLVYSTVKKSGKTAVAALVARWITETWGSHSEVFCLANDLEQARGRIYSAAVASIELDPRFRRADKGIRDIWRIIETNRTATHLPTYSTLKAVSADYKGEAGSNPVATLWSELWGYCLSDDTSLLTKSGWRRYNEILYGDEVATLNQRTGSLEYQRPTNIHVQNYSGDMVRFKHRRADMLVTPNHSVYMSPVTRKPYPYRRIEASRAMQYGQGVFTATALWTGVDYSHFELPAYKNFPARKVPADAWMSLLGWYIAEGNVIGQYKDTWYGFEIGQDGNANFENCARIAMALNALGLKYSTRGDGYVTSFAVYDAQIANYLARLGHSHQKHIPGEYRQASKRQLLLLFDAYIRGDGWPTQTDGWQCETTSARLVDDLLEVGLKCGYAPRHMGSRKRTETQRTIHRLSFSSAPIAWDRRTNAWSVEPYNGTVWCVTVPNSVVYARRNGTCYWTGNSTEASQRLWDELTPVPTRPRSIRYVETYAGYDGESSILNDLEDRVKKEGRRLTYGELTEELGLSWPFDHTQPVPFFVHEPSRTLAYWDDGEHARRMPWQTVEYYRAQAAELRPQAFERLHLNFRVSATDEFIPIEWWDRLNDPTVPALTHTEPVVLGADASVSGDCTAISLVSRDPRRTTNLLHRGGRIWKPAPGKPLDYSVTIEPEIRRLCTGHIHPHYEKCDSHSKLHTLGVCIPTTPYNIVEVAYDEYQLHDLMSRLRNEGVAWCRKFSQMSERAVADKALYDHIRDMSIHHTGDPDLREHIRNCGAKIPDDDNTKLRLIKRSPKANIDYTVATSMAAHECLRLNL